MSQTDAYGYTYDHKIGLCTSQLNGRKIVFEMSGHSPTMRETPHLIVGHEIRTGGISFVYAETDDPVSDGDWDDFHDFKQAVRGAHNCLMAHYEEDGSHMVMKTDPVYEVRTIWEGQLVASIDCVNEQDAWNTFRESTNDNDGYTVQLIKDDQILAEQTNPDENGEI